LIQKHGTELALHLVKLLQRNPTPCHQKKGPRGLYGTIPIPTSSLYQQKFKISEVTFNPNIKVTKSTRISEWHISFSQSQI